MKTDIKKNKIELTNRLFKCYIDYLRVDLSNFFRNDFDKGRNIDVIVSFRDIFGNILFFDCIGSLLLSNTKDDLDKLEVYTSRLLKKGRNLADIKKENISLSCIEKIFSDDKGIMELTNLFGEILYAAKRFRESSVKPYMEGFKQYCNGIQYKGFVQSVLEVHNAFSHLAAFLYQGDPEDPFKNIDKAKSHLYRAILDYYKILIRFSINKIKKKDVLTRSFYSIRKQEFLFLGQNLENKKIVFFNPENEHEEQENIMIAYKILYETIEEILEHQYPSSQTRH
ncbi:TPA: hypothetical protein RJ349_000568 [Campylobacter jejuni]|nr:hypothetical protein [Campylobacter jejuni]HDV7504249.1 hypothetical protein [Campylobacter jejuni]